MTETGRIQELKGDLVIVAPEKGIACFGCLNMECKKNGGFITAENTSALPLAAGLTVEVRAPLASILIQALAALLPPALGLAASFLLARRLLPNAGEGAIAGIGVVCLFVTAFVIYKLRQKFPVGKAYTVTRVVRE